MDIAELIKTMRTRSRKSIATLAEEMGVTKTSIYNWESGRAVPSAEMLLLVARATGYELIFRRRPKGFYGGGDLDDGSKFCGIAYDREGYETGPRNGGNK